MASLLALLGASSVLQGFASAHPHSNEKLRNSRLLASRDFTARDLYANWPSYDQLPLDPSYPTKAAWGVWGADDVEGALNHITPETIQAAAAEIKVGKAINLNLGLEQFVTPINTARKPTVHLFQPGDGYIDDVVTVNTQVSTQFDGLRHFPYSTDANVTTYQWYNDLIQDFDEVVGPAPSTVLGIQQAAQKGIAGRGVLLDWAGWAESQNVSYSAFAGRGITVDELDAVAAWQGLEVEWSRPGDILLVRTGWGKAYNGLSDNERAVLPWQDGLESVGMLASDESLAWLWSKKLSIVGADNPAFESLPFNKTIDGTPRSLHQVFIGGWGQSIIEFLDLEVLAETLHGLGRSTFFLTLQNLNIVSGIASPPNALAVL